MNQLTYADREVIIDVLRGLQVDQAGSDTELITKASEWARSLNPSLGFEHSLVRDVAALSAYLRTAANDQESAALARGALSYFLVAHQSGSRLAGLDLHDDAFIASFALHEIRSRRGEPTTYDPPALTAAERKTAEDLFLQHIDRPLFDDPMLMSKARAFCADLASLKTVAFLGRLEANVRFLCNFVEQNQAGEPLSWARAALSYVLEEDDAIDDRLGIVGLLDDAFVAEMAVDMIEPSREPWRELLNTVIGVWPFLNDTVLEDDDGARAISEFMIVNASLACTKIGENASECRTALVLPAPGPTPFLVGFIAALGMVSDAAPSDAKDAVPFKLGQKVRIDNAVAIFDGFLVIAGQVRVRLKRFRKRRGEQVPEVHTVPISDLHRLYPADEKRAVGGIIRTRLSAEDQRVTALQMLFHRSDPVRFHDIKRRVLVITPTTTARALAEEASIYGQRLCDVLPMGRLDSSLDTQNWGRSFGTQEPVLLFTSDLDRASAYLESMGESSVAQIVVDLSGANANRSASLTNIVSSGTPVVAIAREQDSECLEMLDAAKFRVWEWKEDDYGQLVWPATSCGRVGRFENRLKRLGSDAPVVSMVAMAEVRPAFEAVLALQRVARKRGDEPLDELDLILGSAFSNFFGLVRATTPLRESGEGDKLLHRLDALERAVRDSLYLSEEERASADEVIRRLLALAGPLENDNPKQRAIAALITELPGLTCVSDIPSSSSDATFDSGLIIPAWWGQQRMGDILVPPIASPLHLVLYDLENDWYQQFVRKRIRDRAARARKSQRSSFFPKIRGWRSPPPPIAAPPSQSLQPDLDDVQHDALEVRRRRLLARAGTNAQDITVDAQMISFEGGAYAFATSSYAANVVTHLLVPKTSCDAQPSVVSKSVQQLQPGDVLLFLAGSDRDAIRATADLLLPAGRRDLARLWQRALRRYVQAQDLDFRGLWRVLREHGCTHHPLTVKHWLEDETIIAPRDAHDHELKIIAEATQDPELTANLLRCDDAISDVWGAHLRASTELARKILSAATRHIAASSQGVFELDDVILARIDVIMPDQSPIPRSMANRLIQDDE